MIENIGSIVNRASRNSINQTIDKVNTLPKSTDEVWQVISEEIKNLEANGTILANKGKVFPMEIRSGSRHPRFDNGFLDIKVYGAEEDAIYRISHVSKNNDYWGDRVTHIEFGKSLDNGDTWQVIISRWNYLLPNNQTSIKSYAITIPEVEEIFVVAMDWEAFEVGSNNLGIYNYVISPINYVYETYKKELYPEIYNLSTNIKGKNVSFGDGELYNSTGWVATDFIPVKPNTLYLKYSRGQHAYYDENLEYVGGAGNQVESMLFRTPDKCYAVRFSVLESVSEKFNIRKIEGDRVSTVKGIFREVLNPFRLSYIKMIGDSNVMGSGGTGYDALDPTHEKAPGVNRYFNEDGYCWANELRDLLVDKFNGERIVNLNHEDVFIENRTPSALFNKESISSYKVTLTSMTPVKFKFYGNKFTLYTSSSAKLEVYENEELIRTIDTNNSDEHVFSFTNTDYHTIRLKVSGGDVVVNGIKLFKTTISKNYGVSGAGTDYINENIGSLLDGDETIVMCLVGSNDRIPNGSSDNVSELKENLKRIYLSILNSGAKPVFLSSTPASNSNETDLERDFDKADVETATMAAAATFGYEHVSVYNYILEYCELTGTPIDNLLADGIHPNDEGYRLAFNYICKEIGIGRKRPDATW